MRDDLAFEIGKVISYAIDDVTGDDPSACACLFHGGASRKAHHPRTGLGDQAGVARLPAGARRYRAEPMTELGLSAAEHARLDSFMLDIAGAARGTPIADSSGNWRFGGEGLDSASTRTGNSTTSRAGRASTAAVRFS